MKTNGGFMKNVLMFVLAVSFVSFGAYWHVASNGSGDRTEGGNWDAGVSITMDTLGVATLAAGDVIFIKDGTHTVHGAIDKNAQDGTTIAPCVIIGVKAATTNTGADIVYSDWSLDSADRPFVDCVTYKITTGDNYKVFNINFQGEAASFITTGAYNEFKNCKFDQDYSLTGRYAVNDGATNRFIRCEWLSATNGGIALGSSSLLYDCYFRDMPGASQLCVTVSGVGAVISNCIFNGIKGVAAGLASVDKTILLNNTYYDCALDVTATDAAFTVIINEIHYATDGQAYTWTTQENGNIFDHNHLELKNKVTLVDTLGANQDYDLTIGDPKFTTNGSNFSLQSDSPCLNTGLGVDTLWAK
jgi:hypothetical protein